MLNASRKSQKEAKRSSHPAACQANTSRRYRRGWRKIATPCFRCAQNDSTRRARTAIRTTIPIPITVRVSSSSCGCAAQKEISNAGSSGSRGAAGSRPWVIAYSRTRRPIAVSNGARTANEEMIAG